MIKMQPHFSEVQEHGTLHVLRYDKKQGKVISELAMKYPIEVSEEEIDRRCGEGPQWPVGDA